MTLSQNQSAFGIHSITAYDIDTKLPIGTAKVIGSVSFNNAGENIPLVGGSNAYPFEIESGAVTADGTILLREIPDWLPEAFLGDAATSNAAEANGSASALLNGQGTSAFDATTGIATITVKAGNEADVKSVKYVIKAVSATTVDVYALSDVDFGRGSDLSYVDDALKITTAPLTVVTGAAVEIPNTGLELTGGSGAIAFVTDDTAYADSRAQNSGSMVANIGTSTQTFKTIGLIVEGQKKGNNDTFTLEIFNAKGTGLPINFTEKAWAEGEIPFAAFYNSAENAVFRMTRVEGT